MLGKSLIAEMHARGEQLDEFIRRFQRYKPQIKFEPGTPEVRSSHVLGIRHASSRLTCHICVSFPAQFIKQVVQAGEQERLARLAEAERALRGEL